MRIRAVPIIGVLWICLLTAPCAWAQSADGHFDTAMVAVEEEDWDEALDELELAYRENPSTRVIYWRIVVLEKAGHPNLALELLRQHRDELADEPEAENLGVLEERLRSAASNDTSSSETADPTQTTSEETTTPPRQGAVIGPILLGTAGLVSTGLAVYGLAAPGCSRQAPDGTCLEGTRTATAPTILYATVGVGALAGAVVWWIASRATPDASVSVTPNGFRFTF